MTKIVIIGGSFGGLTSAFELKRLLKPFGLSYEKSVACSTITTIVIFACEGNSSQFSGT